jgi:hypothetical protein
VLRVQLAFLLCCVAVVMGLSACGDDIRQEPVERQAEETSATSDDTGSSRAEMAEERRRRRERAVEGSVRDFYTEVGIGDYEAAWARLTEPLHATLGGFDTWQAGYGTSLSTRVSSVHAVEASPRDAVVLFELRSKDIDECADPVVQRFAGRWELEKVGRHWRATAISAEKIAGGTPITNVEDCPYYGEELSGESAPDLDPAPTDGYSYPDEPYEEPDYSYEPDEDPDYGYIPDDAYGAPTTEDFGSGQGSVGVCEDGTLSDSIGRQGACSHHGGVAD